MILVQNPRRRLNGNKNSWLLLVLACMIVSSCSWFTKVPDPGKEPGELDPIHGHNNHQGNPGETQINDPVRTVDWKEDGKNPVNVVNLPDPKDPVNPNIHTNAMPEEILKKNSYNITLLLPFEASKYNSIKDDYSRNTKIALHFWEGVKMAVRQLEREGLKANLFVIDTRADSNFVKNNVLQREELLNSDLIIGPLRKDNMKIISEFARLNQKTMISPLSTSNPSKNVNPYFVQVNPQMESHGKAILKYLKEEKEVAPDKILLLAESTHKAISRLETFQKAHQEIEGSSSAEKLKEYIASKRGNRWDMDVKPFLQYKDTTYVIIPSSDEFFVMTCMRELGLLTKNYPVVVFGMPQWNYFEQIGLDYFHNLNVHISSSFYVDPEMQNVKDFKINYYSEFKTAPDIYSYKGYDVAHFFGLMINKYGIYFPQFMDGDDPELMHTRFKFQRVFEVPEIAEEGRYVLKQYENKHVHILKFHEYHFVKMN